MVATKIPETAFGPLSYENYERQLSALLSQKA